MRNATQIFLFLLITLISTQCDTTSEPEAISGSEAIRISSQILTLAQSKGIIEEGALPGSSQVGVFAWGHHKDAGSVNTTLRTDLTNRKYTKENGVEILTTVGEAHYPVNPDTLLNFYAYYPYTEQATDVPQSIPFDLNKQDDIMWATPVMNQSKANNEETVTLAFNHLLSAITLKFKKADDIQEEMKLESISLENYSSALQLNLQEGKLAQTASVTPFTLISDQQTAITPAGQTIVTDYLLCPVSKPVFIVRMSGKDYRIESSKAFEAGKKQTYEFTIQAKDIHLSGSINPWVDGGSSNETVYF